MARRFEPLMVPIQDSVSLAKLAAIRFSVAMGKAASEASKINWPESMFSGEKLEWS